MSMPSPQVHRPNWNLARRQGHVCRVCGQQLDPGDHREHPRGRRGHVVPVRGDVWCVGKAKGRVNPITGGWVRLQAARGDVWRAGASFLYAATFGVWAHRSSTR
eukprot:365047-Chlamydomonas_euryale.AAC.6